MNKLISLLLLFSFSAYGANQNLSNRIQVGTANIVVPGTSAGLVSASGLPGNTTGSAIASTYVGQILTATAGSSVNVASSGSFVTIVSLSVPAGVWIINGTTGLGPGLTGFSRAIVAISSTNNALDVSFSNNRADAFLSSSPASEYVLPTGPGRYVDISSTTTYYLVGRCEYTGGSAVWDASSYIQAIRIA